MNYQRGNVTMLDELPDLEDLEGVGDYNPRQAMNGRQPMEPRPNPQDERYMKYIRNGQRPLDPGAGMNAGPGQEAQGQYGPHGQQEMIMQQGPSQYVPMQQAPPTPSSAYNCVDVAKHIQDCPICSKFYHDDKTSYVIAIIVLSVVCLLLLKRVLNV